MTAKIGQRARLCGRRKGTMLRKREKRGSTLIALLVVVAALAAGPAAGAASAGIFSSPVGNFSPDASWAEGV